LASAAGATSYVYDGSGRRVKKVQGASTTTYVYDAFGRLVAEYCSPASACGAMTGIRYVTTDHLGSTRVVSDEAAQVVARHDYLPFGEEVPVSFGGRSSIGGYGSESGVRQKFTGKERDLETGLDYFGARYFSGAQGRFTIPDVPFADQSVGDPQSWNLYAYVRSNPLRFVDPNGRACFDHSGTASCAQYLLGTAKAVGNIPSDIFNLPNHLTNLAISPFTDFRFPDLIPQTFPATNVDQQEGMFAAAVVMAIAPVAKVGLGPAPGLRAPSSAATGGKTVLGHNPAYVQLAEELGARRLNVPTDVWQKMTPAEQWAANQRFLDRAIRRGDDIVLATPARQARPGSFFARELEYLASKGYTVSPDGLRLVPPAK